MRKPIYSAFALSLLLLTGGCNLYSRYEGRSTEYDTTLLCTQDPIDSPIASLSWRELFTDPLLSVWIEAGLKSNTDLRIAQYKVDEAAATLSSSRLALLPTFDLDADGSTGIKSGSRFTIGPSARWELDVFGKQRNLKLGAEAAFYASQSYRQAVQTALVASIADGYYTLLMLDEQLSISERTLRTWEENIRVLQALKRAGRTNEAAVLQARANRMKVEASTLTLKGQIKEQENAIKSLLLNPDADMRRGTLSTQVFPDVISAGISLDCLSNRPDVRAAEFNLQKSFYDINVARAAFYPSITLSGNAGWTVSGGNIANPSAWIANALGSISAPLFNKGINKANLEIAKAEYEISFLEFQQKLIDAGMEVNDAITAWQTAKERLILDKKQIVALQGAVHNTRLLMRNSDTNYLEVLTAQQRLLEAELTEATDRYNAILSIITLYHALGGGVN